MGYNVVFVIYAFCESYVFIVMIQCGVLSSHVTLSMKHWVEQKHRHLIWFKTNDANTLTALITDVLIFAAYSESIVFSWCIISFVVSFFVGFDFKNLIMVRIMWNVLHTNIIIYVFALWAHLRKKKLQTRNNQSNDSQGDQASLV